jgi:hypothetical protein
MRAIDTALAADVPDVHQRDSVYNPRTMEQVSSRIRRVDVGLVVSE